MSAIEKFGDMIRQDESLAAMLALQKVHGSPTLALVPYSTPEGDPRWDVIHLLDEQGRDYEKSVVGRGATPADAIEDAFGRLRVAETVMTARKEFKSYFTLQPETKP